MGYRVRTDSGLIKGQPSGPIYGRHELLGAASNMIPIPRHGWALSLAEKYEIENGKNRGTL